MNGGATTGNGHSGDQNNLFKDVADKGAGGKDKGKETPSGDELLNYLKELSKEKCCIKKLIIAGHGWASVSEDGTPAGDGPGIPGKADGSGLYEDGPNGDAWAKDSSAARISDLQKDIDSGNTRFCQPCEIKIHACNISSSFAESLGKATKCKVTYAKGICSPRARNRKWHSGVGDEPGYDGKENGFWQTNGGAPSVSVGNTITP